MDDWKKITTPYDGGAASPEEVQIVTEKDLHPDAVLTKTYRYAKNVQKTHREKVESALREGFEIAQDWSGTNPWKVLEKRIAEIKGEK